MGVGNDVNNTSMPVDLVALVDSIPGVEVAGAQQIAEAGVALVVAIFGVVADDAADLVRLEVAAEHRARRHADGKHAGAEVGEESLYTC